MFGSSGDADGAQEEGSAPRGGANARLDRLLAPDLRRHDLIDALWHESRRLEAEGAEQAAYFVAMARLALLERQLADIDGRED